ncbi:MAG: hypothetical protein ACJAS4_001060 [Bacteriovoracaceae bacterium]|jgi:hypothetical protein
MIKDLYFCENCRIPIKTVGEIHFVEEHSDRGFCSESCIMEFYRPFMLDIEKEEASFREELGLVTEDTYSDILGNKHYLDLVLKAPTQTWYLKNELEQTFYTHILDINYNGNKLYFIIICSYVEGEPSFVYYRTATIHKNLVEKYRRDTEFSSTLPIEDDVGDFHSEQIEIANDIIESLEGKKSSILAEMMENRNAADIQIEQFLKYDKYLDLTIEEPDEIYENEDLEGDMLHTFIKSFKEGEVPFFYIVITFPHKIPEAKEMAVLPILGFPSIDESLYPKYAVGRKLNEMLKN